ncbi:MAG: oxygenase MpaB family protein [Polyangiaceae bacterium]|jgi:hypothetical protein
MLPTRFTNLDCARSSFGDRVDRLGPYLLRADPLADAVVETIEHMGGAAGWSLLVRLLRERGAASGSDVPAAFGTFFQSVEQAPFWVDWDVLDGAGAVLRRAGPIGGIVLGLKALVSAYASPGGNKPLVFTGRLREQAGRRLNETARFVRETILQGGMRPYARGWQLTLKVRIIHARARRMILQTGRWDTAAWGTPINQHDEAGTSLLFSVTVLQGLRQLGMHVSQREGEAYVQLWRWSSWLMGVESDLLVATEHEGERLAELIRATQAGPDEDSRALTRALLEAPLQGIAPDRARAAARSARVGAALCRVLIGDATADELAVPQSHWRHVAPLVRRLVSSVDLVRQKVSFAEASALRAGDRYWDRVSDVGLTDATADLILPELSDAA